ncbi:MAG: VOC family protein [Myxococcota bacterium]
MKGRVTGIGGIFFKVKDPAATRQWYRDHLGVDTMDFGAVFQWRETESENIGYSVWAPFDAATEYFEPSDSPFMVNYRVENIEALLEELGKAGIVQVGELKVEPNGKFAWVLDPDGKKIELWEPVPSKDDPYL